MSTDNYRFFKERVNIHFKNVNYHYQEDLHCCANCANVRFNYSGNFRWCNIVQKENEGYDVGEVESLGICDLWRKKWVKKLCTWNGQRTRALFHDYDKFVYIVKQLEDFRRCALRDFKILRKRCRDLEEKLNWISETETE